MVSQRSSSGGFVGGAILIGLGLFLILRRTNLWPGAGRNPSNPLVEAAPRPPEP